MFGIETSITASTVSMAFLQGTYLAADCSGVAAHRPCGASYSSPCALQVIQLRRDGEQLITDVDGIAAAIASLGADRVAAVITTTSCFAPRAADDVVAVGKLCDAAGVPHIVNNAYGVQAAGICAQVRHLLMCGIMCGRPH